MKIFALETDEEKLIRECLSQDEKVLLRVKFSMFLFVIRSIRALLISAVFIAVGVGFSFMEVPMLWVIDTLVVIWIPVVGWKWLTAYIDWRFDVLVVTSEEVIIIDQSSLFKRRIRQMNLENIATVSAESQYLNLLPFGKVHFDLKEGIGNAIVLGYIPQSQKVASAISDAIVMFQRRSNTVAQAAAPLPPPAEIPQQ